MQQIFDVLLNNGITAVILAYFLFRDNKFMTELTKTLVKLQDSFEELKKSIDK